MPEKLKDTTTASMLAKMEYPDSPVAMGVFRAYEQPTYDEMMTNQVQEEIKNKGAGDLETILNQGDTWVVE